MKRFLLAMLSVMLIMTSCTARNNTASSPSSSTPQGPSAEKPEEESAGFVEEDGLLLEDISLLEHAVREFGEEDGILQYGDIFSCKILYPVSGMIEVDQTIAQWAKQACDDASREIEELAARSDNPQGSLTYNYNSYLIQDQFAGVEEIGFYTHSGLAHPIDPIAVFNIDLQSQKIIPNSELFTTGKTGAVLEQLSEKLQSENPEISANMLEALDESWLENALLKPEGVEIILERGSYLPSYLGTKRVLFSYKELGDALSIGHRLTAQSTETPQNPADESKQDGSTAAPSRNALDKDRPVLALTFDDGPTVTTGKILDLLEEHGGRATFFMVGNSVQNRSEIVQRMVAQGSEVANHTWDHKPLNKLDPQAIRQQLQSTSDVIYEVCGVRPVLMRPPYGAFNDQVKTVASEMEVAIINWSVDTLDWKTRDAAATYNSIINEAQNGSIILCHDLHRETGEAMVTVIPELIARGYQLVTVSELLNTAGAGAIPGTVYTSA